MGDVINFKNASANHLPLVSKFSPNMSTFLNNEDPLVFWQNLQKWPCFRDLDENVDLEGIFELYNEDELTLSQDCVIEYQLHMQNSQSNFDIANALYTWDEQDREYFLFQLASQASFMDKLKSEEY